MLFIIIVTLLIFTDKTFLFEINQTCTTPNGEIAKCIQIERCNVISDAIQLLQEDKLNFAKASQCNDTDEILVCCGSTGEFVTHSTTVNADFEESFSTPLIEPLQHPKLPDPTVCGVQEILDRISGGKKTELKEFPWLVALKYENTIGRAENSSFRCSGTLITKSVVLTAAQCLDIIGYNLTQVRLGEWKFSSDPDYDDNESHSYYVEVDIAEKIPHSYYDPESGNNDIALLRLKKLVSFSDTIRPICLPPSNLRNPTKNQKFVIAGWGVTEQGKTSDVKLKAEVPVVDSRQCLLVYPNYTHITINQICAGGEKGIDACEGDSGGPIMRSYKHDRYTDRQWYQEGIIYRGLGCGLKGKPGLYTRVTRYTKWILNNI